MSQADSFISDDEEELCPLCVEEMDLSDKNFKPCPCGYQVCQFCYNNIRQNPQLNGKCPGCRRPYDDESVEYRQISAEEWKQEHAKQSRKEKEKKQKEREKKGETDPATKKHLSGMRVIQKNLVYVVGLNPNIPTEELHNTLRGDQFFGQYGKIQKIVINKRHSANGNPGLGVYVTFARREDATRCIQAVDGSINDGKYLRAAYGTTKYCSSYLRGQPCPNPHCMFLHEPGEEADSYTRQDLSTIQHAAKQNTSGSSSSSKAHHGPAHVIQQHSSRPQSPVIQHPPVHSSSAAHDDDHSHTVSALPSTASWAQKASPPTVNNKLAKAAAASPATTAQSAAPAPAPAPAPSPAAQTAPVAAPPTAANFMLDSVLPISHAVTFKFNSKYLSQPDFANMPSLCSFHRAQVQQQQQQAKPRQSSLYSYLNGLTGGLSPKSGVLLSTRREDFSIVNADAYQTTAKAATPPPPGIYGRQSHPQHPPVNSGSHELLAHLMNGTRGETTTIG